MSTSEDAVARLAFWASETPAARILDTAGGSCSYQDFWAGARELSGRMRAQRCRKGDRVAILARDYRDFFISLFATWLTGAVAVPLNADLPARDLQFLVDHAHPALLLHSGDLDRGLEVPAAMAAACAGPLDRTARPVWDQALAPEDLAIILFTSGSTGLPKGACHTLACISANAWHTACALGVTAADRIFVNTPPYFTSGIIHFLTMIARGGSLAARSGFLFGEDLLEAMEALGCTGFGGAPAHLVRVVEPVNAPPRAGFRFWVSSGDHLPASILDKFNQLFPSVRLFNMYGLTEVAGRLCIMDPGGRQSRPGSVGRPIGGNTVQARGPGAEPLDPGQVGELYVTGPLLMQSYLDDPAATGQALTRYGLRTGDFGWTDAEGFVWVQGRRDDIIKRGSEKVSLVQIQHKLIERDDLRDAAVLSVADPLFGRVPVALVVPEHPAAFSPAEALRWLRKELPPASIPARIVAVPRIPRNGAGKVIRAELAQWAPSDPE
jgi:acyl-CoA synthetase (AMP-forming)/AMP-acid ligase II